MLFLHREGKTEINFRVIVCRGTGWSGGGVEEWKEVYTRSVRGYIRPVDVDAAPIQVYTRGIRR